MRLQTIGEKSPQPERGVDAALVEENHPFHPSMPRNGVSPIIYNIHRSPFL